MSTGRALMLIFIAFGFGLWLVGMFGALLTDPAATEPTVTPTIAITIVPASPAPVTPTSAPTSARELIIQTPTTREPTPTSTATATVEPTNTRVPVQKG